MYINGELDNSTSSTLTMSYSNLSDTTRNGLNIGMQLNEDYDATLKKITFDGTIDEVRIWNTKLQQYQVQKRMFSELSSSDSLWNNLVGYYQLNENAGKVVYDSKNNCNPGWLIPVSSDCPSWSSTEFPKTLTWGGNTSDDWEVNTNWNHKMKPHKFAKTLIPAGVTNMPKVKTSSTVEVYDIEIQSGGVLRVNSSKQLKVNGNMVIKSGSGNTGNVFVEGTLQVTGTITFERDVTSNGWHYISSPIANTNSNSFMGAALYQYNESTATWSKVGSNVTLTPLKGYDIYYKNTDKLISISGTFNSGNITISVPRSYDGFNLVGNPYPTTVDWGYSTGWTKTNLNPQIYIWDPAQNNYMTYNNGVGTNGGSRYIPPTQAFFIRSKSGGGSLTIKNSARVTNTTMTYRDDDLTDVLYLKVKNDYWNDETVIRFTDNANRYFDDDYDAEKLLSDNMNVPQIYTKGIDDVNYTINAMPEQSQAVSIPLHVRCNISGNYNITPTFIKFNENMDVFLEDLKTGEMINLRNGGYNFYAENSDNPDRFMLHFSPVQNITNDIKTEEKSDINLFTHEGKLYIVSDNNEAQNFTISVYNMLGKLVYSDDIKNQAHQTIDLSQLKGNHIVRLEGNNIQLNKNLPF